VLPQVETLENQGLTVRFRRPLTGLTLIACLLGLCAVSAAWGSSGPAGAHSVTRGSSYLALGDSVTFGFQDPSGGQRQDPYDVAAIVGYPELLAGQLHLTVANASCPGESSTSMINPAGKSDGCEDGINGYPNGYRSTYPLHVRYSGSQLGYGVAYLKAHRNVRLVTVQTGLVDLSLCQSLTPDECASPSEIAAVDGTLESNLDTILLAIRDEAHYSGQIVVVNYYSSSYGRSLLTTLIRNINGVLSSTARSYGAKMADVYGAFATASEHVGEDPCRARLLDVVSPGVCGYHATIAGQTVVANAIRKMIVVGK
jgi:hypothetical protein